MGAGQGKATTAAAPRSSGVARIAALVAVLIAATLTGLLLFGGGDGYTVTARFINAGQLVKGNVVDLAVGVIIGAAFAKIVDSLVGDIVMPLVSRIVGKLDFSSKFIVLSDIPPGTAMTLDALKKAGVPVFAWGSFVTVAVNFLILAFIIFLMVKQINRLRRQQTLDETGMLDLHGLPAGSYHLVVGDGPKATRTRLAIF